MVRVPEIEGGCMSKFFRDTRYGGSIKALVAAQAWRDSTYIQEWDEGYPSFLIRWEYVKKGCLVSIPGVARITIRNVDGRMLRYYVAWWPERTRRAGKAIFSIERRGDEGALSMAIARREEEYRRYLGSDRWKT